MGLEPICDLQTPGIKLDTEGIEPPGLPRLYVSNLVECGGARTLNLLLATQLLYQLSYAPKWCVAAEDGPAPGDEESFLIIVCRLTLTCY